MLRHCLRISSAGFHRALPHHSAGCASASSLAGLRKFSVSSTEAFSSLVTDLPSLPELPSATLSKAVVRDADRVLTSQISASASRLILLSGPSGTGKSISLRLAVARARAEGSFVLYIPNASAWVRGGGFFSAVAAPDCDPLLQGALGTRFYERPFQLRDMLTAFVDAHKSFLDEEQDVKKPCEEALLLLRNVDDDWRSNPRNATDSFLEAIRVLQEGMFTTNRKFIIVIDEYEAMAGLTSLQSERKQLVHANAIRVVAQLFGRDAIFSTAKKIRNGCVVLARSCRMPRRYCRKSRVLGALDYPLSDDIRSDPDGSMWLDRLWSEAAEAQLVHDLEQERENDDMMEMENEHETASESQVDANPVRVEFEKFTAKEMMLLAEHCQEVPHRGLDRRAVHRCAMLSAGRADVFEKLYSSL